MMQLTLSAQHIPYPDALNKAAIIQDSLPHVNTNSMVIGNEDIKSVTQEELSVAMKASLHNVVELEEALNRFDDDEMRDAVAFLIAYMPERDLVRITADYLCENVELAFKAKNEFAWCKDLPEAIFLNEVLPYCNINEKRVNWRPSFYEMFMPIVKDCKTMEEAAFAVKANIVDQVGVSYNTKSKFPHQCTEESMASGYATCTGLSILLSSALRAVGIPCRVAGTPLWLGMERGNHTWNEIWIDGKWYYTEYSSNVLDNGWFRKRAGNAENMKSPRNWIYAASFKPAEQPFPLSFARHVKYVSSVNVTQRYVDIYEKDMVVIKADANKVKAGFILFEAKNKTQGDDRIVTEITLLKDGKVIKKGKTPGPRQDMNEMPEFMVEKGKDYYVSYTSKSGVVKKKINITKGSVIKLYN
jgi:hypothetical protein